MSAPIDSPAFPSHGSMGEVCHEGMTLRDYFAAKALQGMLACSETSISILRDQTHEEVWARAAFQYADAMLKEREK